MGRRERRQARLTRMGGLFAMPAWRMPAARGERWMRRSFLPAGKFFSKIVLSVWVALNELGHFCLE
jgi:hypothetical protein